MKRRDRPTPHHPLPHHRPNRQRRQQSARRHVHSLMLAGAAFFAPHAGVPPARPAPPIKLVKVQKTQEGLVSTTSLFHLPKGQMPGERQFDALIEEASRRHGLSTTLIRAVIRTESAFNSLAVSPAGAQGLMQLMPALCLDLKVKDPFDPRQNIMAGTRYLKTLLVKHNWNLPLALASYNAGPGNVERYQGIPPFKETLHYVERITKIVGLDVEANE